MSGLLPPSSIGSHTVQSGVLNEQPQLVSPPDNPLEPISSNELDDNDDNSTVSLPQTFPLEVKFECKDPISGETRIILEELPLTAIDNVRIIYNLFYSLLG